MKKKRLRKPPKWLPPDRAMRDYYRALRDYVKAIYDLIDEVLSPRLPSLVRSAGFVQDGARSDAWETELDNLLREISFRLTDNPPIDAEALARNVGQRVSEWNETQWQKIIRSVLGVDLLRAEPWLNPLLKDFVAENAALISSIRTQSLEKLRDLMYEGITTGRRHEKIALDIQRRYGIDLRRARLIARDQTNKLNGQLMHKRQTDVGVTEYIWRTSMDERVRGDPGGLYPDAYPSHYDREGRRYKWSEPPEDGHPGEAIQCRCTAEPDLTPVAEQLEAQGV